MNITVSKNTIYYLAIGNLILWEIIMLYLKSHNHKNVAQNELLGVIQEVKSNETETRNITLSRSTSIVHEKKALRVPKESPPNQTEIMRNTTSSWTPNSTNYTNKTLMCAMVKDEEAYIDEWVDYHHAIGFDHFHIYDNSEKGDMKSWGEKKGDHVTVTHWPKRASQRYAYVDCAKTAVLTPFLINNVTYTWAAFFDVDEFLLLRKHEDVHDFLEEHLQYGLLGINWLMVRPVEGDLLYSPLPVTKRFQHREIKGDRKIKSIVRLSDMDMSLGGRLGVHYFKLKDKTKRDVHDTDGRHFLSSSNRYGSPQDVASLYHFRTKSYKENLVKRLKGDSDNWYTPDQDPKLKDAKEKFDEALSNPNVQPEGLIHDDALWKAVKKYVPKYAAFDQW